MDNGQSRRTLTDASHTPVIKPGPLQQAVPGGFTAADFTVDATAATVTCPAGHTKTLGKPQANGHLRDSVVRCDDFLPSQRDAVAWMKTSDTG